MESTIWSTVTMVSASPMPPHLVRFRVRLRVRLRVRVRARR